MDTSTFRLNLDPNKPEGNRKSLGGGKADEWNDRLSNLTVSALPIAHSKNNECRVQSAGRTGSRWRRGGRCLCLFGRAVPIPKVVA
jgi:hypothetical protein